MRIAGRWRITEAELWDCDALNLVAPAFIEFAEDGSSGNFGFIAVQGEMDCRKVEADASSSTLATTQASRRSARRPKPASEHPSSGGRVVP